MFPNPQIRGVETSADRLRAGVTGRVQTSVGIGVAFVVTDVDPGRHTWSWLVHVAGRSFTLHHGLVAVAMGTRATLAIEGPGGAARLAAARGRPPDPLTSHLLDVKLRRYPCFLYILYRTTRHCV